MRWILAIATISMSSVLYGADLGQQGGDMQQNDDRTVRGIERRLATYLDTREIKNILSPGEFNELTLKDLKAGQVVLAEARSDAFDPALQIVGDKETVVAANDDRYPGDQRPLLMWRCDRDGNYGLRVRCFHDKSGGQFFLRYRVYDCMDLLSDKQVARNFEKTDRFMLRIPMKAGQIKQLSLMWHNIVSPYRIIGVISPLGLPDINLASGIAPVAKDTILAPVDGDYYVVIGIGQEKLTAYMAAYELLPKPLDLKGVTVSAQAPANTPTIWSVSVKKGQALEVSTPGLDLFDSQMLVTEIPDISGFSLAKNPAHEDMNPFYPRPEGVDTDSNKGSAFTMLPARARDGRIAIFVANRDATLWIATNARGKGKTYAMNVKPAFRDFVADSAVQGKLQVGRTDYWAFDAKAGDIMTFKGGANTFSSRLAVLSPDLGETWNETALPDQTTTNWDMVVQEPGRYLVSVACMGDGGGGDYSLARKVFHARDFGKTSPATGDFADGQVKVWKFAAKPNEPMLIRWKSSDWSYRAEIRDDTGAEADLPLTQVDGTTKYGILKVDKPRTFLIVMFPNGHKANYSIELGDLPGFGKS